MNWICFALVFYFFVLPIKSEAQNYKEDNNALEAIMKEARIVSAGMAIIENGEVVYKSSFGFLDQTKREKSRSSTLYNVASISKSLTAWGVMKLVENGKLALDSPVNKYLRRWRLPPYQGDSIQVTVKMLLSHTAGLSMGAVMDYAPDQKMPSLPEALADLKIIQQPGQSFRYSGGGYMLLQLLIEDVTGKKFSVYMKEEVLNPLGMFNSSFELDAGRKNVAIPYDETLTPAPDYGYVGISAAGLYTSVDELSKFVIASMGIQPNPVLKLETLNLMKKGITKNYGLGYSMEHPDSSITLIGHGGASSGWRASYYFNSKGSGIVLMANSSFNDFTNLGLCQWIRHLYKKESQYCSQSQYTSIVVDLFSKGQLYTAKRVEQIRKETKQDPIPEFACNILGYWRMRLERWEGARTFFEFNTLIFKNSANAFDSLGEFYENRHDKQKAIKSYSRAIQLNPGLQSSKNALQRLQ